MNKHLKGLLNPSIKEKVLANFATRNARDKELRDRYLGPAIDEILVGLPSKHKEVKLILDKNKKERPIEDSVIRFLGSSVRDLAVGGGAIGGLSKLGKIGSLIKRGGIGASALKGAVYGGTGGTLSGKGESIPGAIAGGLVGGGLGLAGKGIKGLANLIRAASKTSKMDRGRAIVEKEVKKLAGRMNAKDFAHLRKLKSEGTDSFASGKLDTLLHNPTENTKAVADAYYEISPAARQIILNQKEQLGKNMEGMMEHAFSRASGVGKVPNADKFVEMIQKRGRAQARPIYDEVYKGPSIELSERVEGSPKVLAALKKAMAARNKADIKKPDFQRTSPRILDETKRHLDDELLGHKTAGTGGSHEAGILKKERKELVDLIEAKSPKYKEARAVAEKYLKTGEGAEQGKEFLKTQKELIPDQLKKLDDNQKLAYRLGALQERLEKVRKNAQNAEFGDITRHVTNPEIVKKLEMILPSGKTENLQKDVVKVKKAIDAMKEYTAGSNTAKHESNKELIETTLRAVTGGKRAKYNLVKKAINAMSGGNEDQKAKIGIRTLLRPEKLLKYEGKPINKPSKYAGPLAGLYVNREQ